MLHVPRLLQGRIAWVHYALNVVRLFSFVFPFSSLLFPSLFYCMPTLRAMCDQTWGKGSFHVFILVISFRFLFVCISVSHLVAF